MVTGSGAAAFTRGELTSVGRGGQPRAGSSAAGHRSSTLDAMSDPNYPPHPHCPMDWHQGRAEHECFACDALRDRDHWRIVADDLAAVIAAVIAGTGRVSTGPLTSEYRVVLTDAGVCEVREVRLHADGAIAGWTSVTAAPQAQDVDALRRETIGKLVAFTKPALLESDLPGYIPQRSSQG